MKYYKEPNLDIVSIYAKYYLQINGGIDGYYEKTILEANLYSVRIKKKICAYFTVYKDRGLTSIYVIDEYLDDYNAIFNYILELPLFDKALFSENDSRFIRKLKELDIKLEKQAYNFKVNKQIDSKIRMKQVLKKDIKRINDRFNDFIEYNNIDLNSVTSFYYEIENDIIGFGAIEPLKLNKERYCISMIVDVKYRSQGFGTQIVRYLIKYLQSNNWEINARCYVLNEASLKTLLKSGMEVSNMLYRCDKIKEHIN